MEQGGGKADVQEAHAGQDDRTNTTVWVGDTREDDLFVAEDLMVEPVQDQLEPVKDLVVEPVQDQIEPVKDLVVEPVQDQIEPVKDLVLEPVQTQVEPVKDLVAEPVQDQIEPVKDLVVELVQDQIEPVKDLVVELVQNQIEPVKDLVVEPVQDQVEPVKDLVLEPVQDQVEPIKDLVVEPDTDALSETDEDLWAEPDEDLSVQPDEDLPLEPENDQSRHDVTDTTDLKVNRLYLHAKCKDIEAVRQFGSDLNMTNSQGRTALDIARDVMRDEKAARLLEEAGVKSAHVKLSEQLETENQENLNVKQIYNAAKFGDPGTLHAVVSNLGASIDAVDTQNRTALMLAVDENEVVAAATLGQSHASVSEDILDTAIRGGGEDMVQTLLTCAELSTQGGCGAGNEQPAAVDEIKELGISTDEDAVEDLIDIQESERSGTKKSQEES